MNIEKLIHPVIIAGGSGTRLWPLSRSAYPKQFHAFGESEHTLLQQTQLRLAAFTQAQASTIIGNSEHRFIIAEQMRRLELKQSQQIILEPEGRNTAAAVLVAAVAVAERDPEAIMLVCSADHHLPDTSAFRSTALQAAELAESNPQALVCLGVQPDSPSSDYGYIEKGEHLGGASHRIQRFTEKPDAEQAERFILAGTYLWNAGIFIGKAQAFLQQAQQHCPELLQDCRACYEQIARDYDFQRLPEQFAQVESVAFDYAVMEPSQDSLVVTLDTQWSDLGGWRSIWSNSSRDQDGNCAIGNVVAHDCQNSYLRSSNRLLTVLGASDIVVVETSDAVFVAHQDKLEAMRNLVNKMRDGGHSELEHNTLVHRPWGNYESLDLGNRFQVKRITVLPGQKLSVQMHHHRAEYWVVVAGTAKVHLDGDEQLLREGESVYIPLGSVHALENPGKLDLVLIEVQNGAYLGEDDIVRFEDRYGRAPQTIEA